MRSTPGGRGARSSPSGRTSGSRVRALMIETLEDRVLLASAAGVAEVWVERGIDYGLTGTSDDAYEYDVEVRGEQLTGLQIQTPWAEAFDSATLLPGGWSGEAFSYISPTGDFQFLAGTSDGVQFFEAHWLDLTTVQWSDTTSAGAVSQVTVDYAGNSWSDSVTFGAVDVPAAAPYLYWPYDGATGVELSPLFQWSLWSTPPGNGLVEVTLEDDGGETVSEIGLPSDATEWGTYRPLAAASDYEVQVAFNTRDLDTTPGFDLYTQSWTETAAAFTTTSTHYDANFDLDYVHQTPLHATEFLASAQTVYPSWWLGLRNLSAAGTADWNVTDVTFDAAYELVDHDPALSSSTGYTYTWDGGTIAPGDTLEFTALQATDPADTDVPFSVERTVTGNPVGDLQQVTTTITVTPEAGYDFFEVDAGLAMALTEADYEASVFFGTVSHVSASSTGGALVGRDDELHEQGYEWRVDNYVPGQAYEFTFTVLVDLDSGVSSATFEPWVEVGTSVPDNSQQWLYGQLTVPGMGQINVAGDQAIPDWMDQVAWVEVDMPFYAETETTQPDLVGAAFDIVEAGFAYGQPFHANMTVANTGNAASAATTVEFYLSANNVWGDSDDVLLGSSPLAAIAAGASVDLSNLEFSLPSTPPTGYPDGNALLYVGAVIDPGELVAESNETNNANVGRGLDWDDADIVRADLTGTNFSAPAEVGWGQSFLIDAVVANTGPVSSVATRVDFYLSADAVFDGSADDVLLGSASLAALTASGVQTLNDVLLTMPDSAPTGFPTEGAVYVGMIVDPDDLTPEYDHTNNANQGAGVDYAEVSVVTGPPDLAGALFNSEEPLDWGDTFYIRAQVINAGAAASGVGRAAFFLSADAIIGDAGDIWLGGVAFRSLGAGQTQVIAGLTLTLPANPPGAFTIYDNVYIGMVVDPANMIDEVDETNNASTGDGIDRDPVTVSRAPLIPFVTGAAAKSAPPADASAAPSADSLHVAEANTGLLSECLTGLSDEALLGLTDEWDADAIDALFAS